MRTGWMLLRRHLIQSSWRGTQEPSVPASGTAYSLTCVARSQKQSGQFHIFATLRDARLPRYALPSYALSVEV
jgi:hypothetical protein